MSRQKDKFVSPLEKHLQDRYLYDGNWDILVNRVSIAASSVESNEKRNYWKNKFANIIKDMSFIPAGNTLISGIKKNEKTFPNCSILNPPTDETLNKLIKDATLLWNNATGIGINLSNVSDPVSIMYILHNINIQIKFLSQISKNCCPLLTIAVYYAY